MSRWFRVYGDLVDDPKVQRLPPALFKTLINLWCLASQSDGVLPCTEDIAFRLRIKHDKLEAMLIELRDEGLLDGTDGTGYRPHNWDVRQFKSDVTDPTNAERQKRYRNRHGVTPTVTENVTVSNGRPKRPDTDTDTDTEKSTANAVSTPRDEKPSSKDHYAFEKGVIRLKQKDFDQWKQAFSHLDLAAELISLAPWADEQPPGRWFHAVGAALAKRNRELGLRLEQAKNGPLFKTASGMDGII